MFKSLPRPVVPLMAAAVLGLPQPALASNVEQVSHVVVYRDLDLTHPLGVATLKLRVDHALRRICRDDRRAPLYEAIQRRDCLADAEPAAEAQVRQVVHAARLRAGLPPTESLARASLSARR